jgi:hypothetical protein
MADGATEPNLSLLVANQLLLDPDDRLFGRSFFSIGSPIVGPDFRCLGFMFQFQRPAQPDPNHRPDNRQVYIAIPYWFLIVFFSSPLIWRLSTRHCMASSG